MRKLKPWILCEIQLVALIKYFHSAQFDKTNLPIQIRESIAGDINLITSNVNKMAFFVYLSPAHHRHVVSFFFNLIFFVQLIFTLY